MGTVLFKHPDPSPIADHPLARLSREDLDVIVALTLESGSLKGLADRYGVSYPTIRSRLDSVIARLRDALGGREPNPLAELVASLVERGELGVPQARRILEVARRQAERGT